MGYLQNNADTGSNGTLLTAANTGGAMGTAMDVGGTNFNVVYSNAVVLNGDKSFLFTPTGGSNSSFVMFRNAGGTANTLTFTPTSAYCSAYFYFVTSIPTIGRMMQYVVAAFSLIAGVGVNATDKLTLVNSAGTTINTSTTTLPIGAWFRIEMWATSSSTAGQVIAKIFLDPNSTTATETITSATNINTRGGAISAVIWGFPTTTTTSVVNYIDSCAISTDNWVGPVDASLTNFLVF